MDTKISRRAMVQLMAGAGASLAIPTALTLADEPAASDSAATPAAPKSIAPVERKIPPAPEYIIAPDGFGKAEGPFKPNWESLSQYQHPEWYRDAKLGIWAHWGSQCQPEMGDWYAQHMYQFNTPIYKAHCEKYGHPSQFGFKDVMNLWKAENWDPAHLLGLYKKAGAKFFAAMANHHDNMDMWNSKYQPWNTVNVGPKKDIVAGWEKATRDAGLRFALTCHGDRAWDWLQVSQDADPSGSYAGVPYDGLLSKEDGKGLWWEGLDPQHLYAQYHARGKYGWNLSGNPPVDKAYSEKFLNRIIDLVDQHHPDLLYFDDTVLPIYPSTDIGLRIAAYLFNTNMARHGGKLEAVMTGKGLRGDQRKSLVLDVERGVTSGHETIPWQTDTCIGGWHYDKSVFDRHRYKSAKQVVQMLVDIVSKNGVLMLNIPLKGDGTPDTDELKVLDGLASWIGRNGEAIYGTRPWEIYGEGPSVVGNQPKGRFGGSADVRNDYTAKDFRFTTKGDTLYAFFNVWPSDGKVTIESLAEGSAKFPKQVGRVEILGSGGDPLKTQRDASGLTITLPPNKPNEFAFALKILPG